MMSNRGFERVACCVDLTERSRQVQARAAAVAAMAGAELTIVHVAPPPATAPSGVIPSVTTPAGTTIDIHASLDAWLEQLASRDPYARAELIEGLGVGETLCAWADSNRISLIVVGSREGGVAASLGSTASYLVRHAPCDVLVVRGEH
jgi:nucleotide-binding universal stress UspA family protein